jgi:plastocyanin
MHLEAYSKLTVAVRDNARLHKRQNRLIPVVVGGQQDIFVPNSVRASIGDIIQFQFSSGNHTVTQSSLDAPCQPLQATDPGAIHSGHIPFVEGQTTVGTFNMPVISTEPMFLYCATGPHCQTGQVMIVNP